jgi:hypothetical protein
MDLCVPNSHLSLVACVVLFVHKLAAGMILDNEEILVFQFQSRGVIRDTKDAEAGNNHRAKCVYSVYSVEV